MHHWNIYDLEQEEIDLDINKQRAADSETTQYRHHKTRGSTANSAPAPIPGFVGSGFYSPD